MKKLLFLLCLFFACVTFGTAFTTAPKVNATVKSANATEVFVANVTNVTTTGFDITVYRIDSPGSTWSQNLAFDWMAW